MSFYLKILVLLLGIAIGAYTSFFPIFKNKVTGSIFMKLNNYGWVMVSAIFILILFSIILEYRNEKNSIKKEKTLREIHTALQKESLIYDKDKKSIISTTSISNQVNAPHGIAIGAGGRAQISGINLSNNTFSRKVIIDYYEMKRNIDEYVARNGIVNKNIVLSNFSNTDGGDFVEDIEIILKQMGYFVTEKSTINPVNGENAGGIKLRKTNTNQIWIVVGNYRQPVNK